MKIKNLKQKMFKFIANIFLRLSFKCMRVYNFFNPKIINKYSNICLEDDKCLIESLTEHYKTSGRKQVENATSSTPSYVGAKNQKYSPYKIGTILSPVEQARISDYVAKENL